MRIATLRDRDYFCFCSSCVSVGGEGGRWAVEIRFPRRVFWRSSTTSYASVNSELNLCPYLLFFFFSRRLRCCCFVRVLCVLCGSIFCVDLTCDFVCCCSSSCGSSWGSVRWYWPTCFNKIPLSPSPKRGFYSVEARPHVCLLFFLSWKQAGYITNVL